MGSIIDCKLYEKPLFVFVHKFLLQVQIDYELK